MPNPSQLHEQLVELANRVVAIDVRPFEESGESTLDLCVDIRGNLDAVIALFVDIGEREDPALRKPSDLAFMAVWELRQRLERLDRISGSSDSWAVIGQCSSIRRRAIHAIVEVERALAEGIQAESRLRRLMASTLDDALASRRAYLSYIRAIRTSAAALESGSLTHGQALRLSVANLAKLFGRDVYQNLRIDDRQQLRAIQRRILDWARERASDELHGRRLWQDVAASAELLTGIHRRTELIEHDLHLVTRLLEADGDPPADLLEAVSELEFRCPDFDRLWPARAPGAAGLEAVLIPMHDLLAASLGRPEYVDAIAANRA